MATQAHALLLAVLVCVRGQDRPRRPWDESDTWPLLFDQDSYDFVQDPDYTERLRPASSLDQSGDDQVYERAVSDWLREFNDGYRQIRHEAALISWNYNTNITASNARLVADTGVLRAGWMKPWRDEARTIQLERLRDPFVRRQVMFVRRGTSREKPARTRQIIGLHSKMQEIYNTGKVCVANGTCFAGEPDLASFMQNTRDYNQLLWAWLAWRDAVGPTLRPLYVQFIRLTNMDAHDAEYPDMGAMWRQELAADDLEREVESLFAEVRPLYLQLHAYVRHHLSHMYGRKLVDPTGPLPAHLLGNMWAQQWDALYPYIVPYPKYAIPDVTSEMVHQKYDATRMFRLAERFYTSIGLDDMTREFWERSLIEKPKDGREVACHGSATNFFDGKDYRIRMCAEVTERDLHTVHHEMGHVEYFMAYSGQPVLFQDGANSAFHEAIGETVQYSVLTPEHLHHIHLLKTIPKNYESDINFLLKQALLKIPLLPFSLLLDRWRWDVFSGKIKSSHYNRAWWQLRLKYQGIQAPVRRTEKDFDPGAKYHIPDNTPYIRYYMSSFMQLMFHEALCKEKYRGKPKVPIHRCDIYGSKRAGRKFRFGGQESKANSEIKEENSKRSVCLLYALTLHRDRAQGETSMLSLGTSRPWEDALEVLTGARAVSAQPLLRYFQPLYDWLVRENRRLGAAIGWNEVHYQPSMGEEYDFI